MPPTLQLEQLLTEMRRRTVLPLSRQSIEGEICEAVSRLDRWREIRRLIGLDTDPIASLRIHTRILQSPRSRFEPLCRDLKSVFRN